MKKVSKAIVCTILILLVLLGFAAKYWTDGIYPGISGAEILPDDIGSEYISHCPYYFYRNSLGRTVTVKLTSNNTNGLTNNTRFSKYLYSQYGQIVTRVRTSAPALATHWDFYKLHNKNISMFQLIDMAGMPTKIYSVPNAGARLDFQTLDGYTYHIRVQGVDWFYVSSITDPNGNVMEKDAVQAFQNKVEVFYICLLAVLLATLSLGLLAIRKRRTAATAPLTPEEKAARKHRRTKNALCVVMILVTLASYDAKYHTYGVRPGSLYTSDHHWYTENVLGDESILCGGGLLVSVYRNSYGRTVLTRRTLHIASEFDKQIYSIFGGIYTEVQTFPDNITTHLDFFNAHRSIRLFSQILRTAGMPSGDHPVNFADFDFKTIDGYCYRVRASYNGTAWLLGVIDPKGNYIYGEELDTFMVKILVGYLVLAAVLSIALVVLLKKYHTYRKRKEIPAAE